MTYCQGQVKPPPTDYFDIYHMTEIQHFVNSYNVGPEEDITSVIYLMKSVTLKSQLKKLKLILQN